MRIQFGSTSFRVYVALCMLDNHGVLLKVNVHIWSYFQTGERKPVTFSQFTTDIKILSCLEAKGFAVPGTRIKVIFRKIRRLV